MKVAIITPHYQQNTSGNAVTVRRIAQYLSSAGISVRLFSLDESTEPGFTGELGRFSPDLIHAFNAVRCGPIAATLAAELRLPLVITITGTDLYSVGENPCRINEPAVLEKAAGIVTFQGAIGERLSELFHSSLDKISVIPQGVELHETLIDKKTGETQFIFFLPAGIRPVKNILFPFRPLAALHSKYPQVRLVIAGPLLDQDYSKTVLAAVTANPFSSWIGEIPHSEMPQLYSSAAVVLNTSLSEGGMANSLVEAMAHKRPVLASAVEGNRSFLEDGVTGLLYSGEADFTEKAERLILDGSLRKKLGEAGLKYVLENCSPEVEALRHIELYERVI